MKKLFEILCFFLLFSQIYSKNYCTKNPKITEEKKEEETIIELTNKIENNDENLINNKLINEKNIRKIINGNIAVDELKIHRGLPIKEINQLPFMASLWVECRRLCTCSIISPIHILSAGHCFGFKGKYNVMAGTIDAIENNTQSLWANVKKVNIFSEDIFGKDLAIAELESPLSGFDIQPVILSNREISINSTAYIAGWGRIDDGSSPVSLQGANVTIWDNEDPKCDGVLKTEICAFGSCGENTCFGDSGGPLLYKNPETNNWEQIGITSRGSWLCEYKGFFTNIKLYCDWIEKITEGKAKLNKIQKQFYLNIHPFHLNTQPR
ncbi:Peptidase S1 domain-containing protein [Meloidogyne graminicola]|uniref:Peptidase S1 domain-containing protein n=1 Tax=Meloidogyne graminicola TaxID=189291 RepID=A0A8S9ZZN9_9BILA|nr:Peptidase S1 domain-containing protein [Meloidogyne graminicola]